jgi:peroxiredoxin
MGRIMDNKINLLDNSIDFSLQNTSGETVTLSDYQGKKHIVLVLNRGVA